tara:strand:- start:311 stop:1048 length:738 start_codon:yes stop_codon:yes gene_type:complete
MNISIEHILLFLIVIFLFYHFLGNCGCVKEINGFSVGGQSASATCKCNLSNYCNDNHKKLCESNKDMISCTCPDGNNDPSCKGHPGILKNLGCMWSKCNSSSFDKEKNIKIYTFDLTPLNLDPSEYIIGYRYTNGKGWSVTKSRHDGGIIIDNDINQEQLSILDCLYNQAKIFYIGVDNNYCIYDPLADYKLHCGSLKETDFTFYDNTGDHYSLSIYSNNDNSTHQTCYSSKDPILKKLIVVQDN